MRSMIQNSRNSVSVVRIRVASVAFVCLVAAISASCAHPGQVTLQIGQCVLDDGVLGRVFAALGQEDYAQEIADLFLRDAPDLVDCALRAIASQSTGVETESGSSTSPTPATAQQSSSLQVLRAREMLARRKSASGAGR